MAQASTARRHGLLAPLGQQFHRHQQDGGAGTPARSGGERHVPRSDMRPDTRPESRAAQQQKPQPVKRATLAPSTKEHAPQSGAKRPGPNRAKPGRPNPHKPKHFRKPG